MCSGHNSSHKMLLVKFNRKYTFSLLQFHPGESGNRWAFVICNEQVISVDFEVRKSSFKVHQVQSERKKRWPKLQGQIRFFFRFLFFQDLLLFTKLNYTGHWWNVAARKNRIASPGLVICCASGRGWKMTHAGGRIYSGKELTSLPRHIVSTGLIDYRSKIWGEKIIIHLLPVIIIGWILFVATDGFFISKLSTISCAQ